jgi:uncharacterized protein (DUF433 family)
MKTETAKIVDRGRGPQLSNSRITVLDLVHYFQRGASYEEIIRWIPSLSHLEIALLEQHYRDNQEEFDEQERAAQAYRAEQIRLQHSRFPPFEGTSEEHRARLKELLEKRRREKNGEGHPGRQ